MHWIPAFAGMTYEHSGTTVLLYKLYELYELDELYKLYELYELDELYKLYELDKLKLQTARRF